MPAVLSSAAMTSRTAAVMALLLAAGCGAETPPPAAKPAPPPVKTEPAPEPAPPSAPTGRALLVATEYGLSPIACFLDQEKKFAAGETCLGLGPVGAEAWLLSGATAKVTGRGEATCPGADAPEPTLAIDAAREALRGDALLPASARELLTYVPPTLPPDVDKATTKELRERVTTALTAAYPALGKLARVRVEQRALLDLDGDGAAEELVAASVPGKDEDAALRVSALLHGPENGALAPLRGRTDTSEHYTVIGALDLDGDGKRELYLNTYDDDGFSLSVERRAPEGLVSEGRWSCGP
jgi:hypothetical protein